MTTDLRDLFGIKGRLASRLVLYILIWSSIITLLLTAYQLYRQYRLDVAAVHQQIDQIRIGSLGAINNNLWVVNHQNIAIILDSLNALPDIQFLEVRDEDGKLVAKAGEPATSHVITEDYPMHHRHRDRDIAVGSLHVEATLDGVYARLWDQVIVILISQATKTFLVSLFIFLLIQWLVTRHLNTIARWAASLKFIGGEPPLTLDRAPSRPGKEDALSEVVDAFNRMRGNLDNAYQQLVESRDTLNEQVQARTRELEETNKELSSFSYSVSHDLRAPLRGISGFSQALLEDHADRLDDEGRELLQRIINASKRMSGLIDDLLRLAQLSRTAMRIVDIDVSNMAAGICHELSQIHPERNMSVEIAPGMRARADAVLLRSVMENLLSNAWKYTAKTAQPQVSVSALSDDDETVLCVTDNGAGFDMAYADKLFTPFQRLHKESEFAGNGIGLAIVQRIVHRHGGRVWAEGTPGQGARFCFSLPDTPHAETSIPDAQVTLPD